MSLIGHQFLTIHYGYSAKTFHIGYVRIDTVIEVLLDPFESTGYADFGKTNNATLFIADKVLEK